MPIVEVVGIPRTIRGVKYFTDRIGINVADPATRLSVGGTIMNAGPAAVTSFAGTVSSSGTTVTFSSAADAILAGYSATNPVIGVTIIAAGLTRYITSWTNATVCEVGTAPSPAWGATAITSTQFPISVTKTSAGAVSEVVTAAGNRGIGTTGPVTRLHLNGSNSIITTQPSANDGQLTGLYMQTLQGLDVGSITTNSNTGEVRIGSKSANYFPTFYSGNAEVIRITTNGNVGLGTTFPIGKQQTVLSSTAPALFGGATIGSWTTVTFPTANKNYVNKTGIGTGTSGVGDFLSVTAGTGATVGAYRIAALISADSVQVDRNIHAAGADITDGAVSIARDVVFIGATDGTNGQRLAGYSRQAKPLQIGGDTLAATTTMTGKDVTIGGVLNVVGTSVGIGTTGPLVKLHIMEADATGAGAPLSAQDKLVIESDDADSFIYFQGTSSQSQGLIFGDTTRGTGNIIYTQNGDTMKFIANSIEAMKIQNDGDIEIMNGNVGIGTIAPARLLSLGATNGQQQSFGRLTELTTIAAAASTTTTIQIPANTLVMGVSVRVTTVIPTAATFDVGVAGATTRYGTGISTAATTTSPGTLDAIRYYAAATGIVITPNLSPADNTGRVRVTIHFIEVTPPTS